MPLYVDRTHLPALVDAADVPFAIDGAFDERAGGPALACGTLARLSDAFHHICDDSDRADHTEDGSLGHPSGSTNCYAARTYPFIGCEILLSTYLITTLPQVVPHSGILFLRRSSSTPDTRLLIVVIL